MFTLADPTGRPVAIALDTVCTWIPLGLDILSHFQARKDPKFVLD